MKPPDIIKNKKKRLIVFGAILDLNLLPESQIIFASCGVNTSFSFSNFSPSIDLPEIGRGYIKIKARVPEPHMDPATLERDRPLTIIFVIPKPADKQTTAIKATRSNSVQ